MNETPTAAADSADSAENPAYLSEQLITYIGNKRALLDFIGSGVQLVREKLGGRKLDVFDVFSGSGIVSRYLRRYARRLLVNDLEPYAFVINRCYSANGKDADTEQLRSLHAELVSELESGPLSAGFVTELYAPADDEAVRTGERCFYTGRNARFIDTARALIARKVPQDMQPFLIAPLLAEASVHANTAGIFKGFYKNADGTGQFGGAGRNALQRICGDITLPYPVFSNFTCETTVYCGDANRIVKDAPATDLAYIDPPYNQHPYGSNYFMLNLIASGQKPDERTISKVSGIPAGWNRSAYNRKRQIADALENLVANVNARFLLISFNSEGFLSPDAMTGLLSKHGSVVRLERNYNAFRGSRNLAARSTHVTEYLYLVEKR
ncbi:DNA adenine methylase [Treponema brennaborense]|uniref:site-specific DNA-methyltransferase (adenine-specific) n=1 Tax=Treponema brennaborense (strain DSM 12168 / CIP 105900 / DD5/3) TaxID=906968 RepID=F4LPE2_TREBD|nr:DNA adenine methylase [Treponema brennaborense]AEE15953.1 Site-specific DNA-methyltransferase (adenine-specific) [Treponema brennaborense DSM 12168]